MNFEGKRRRAMDQLPRHVKCAFCCEGCNRSYSIRYMDRHHRTYKHQQILLILENVPRIHPAEVNNILRGKIVRLIPLESFELIRIY